jgi:hypothetical protein
MRILAVILAEIRTTAVLFLYVLMDVKKKFVVGGASRTLNPNNP